MEKDRRISEKYLTNYILNTISTRKSYLDSENDAMLGVEKINKVTKEWLKF
jgi:hypothetical protein